MEICNHYLKLSGHWFGDDLTVTDATGPENDIYVDVERYLLLLQMASIAVI